MYYFATVAPWGIVLLLLALLLTVPRAVERRRATGKAAVIPPAEPRVPRDMSRTYPRPKGSRSKLNRVCPVCGTGRETGGLDRRVFGWPAHRTCAEYLGGWKPECAVPPETVAELQRALDAYPEHPAAPAQISVSASPGAQVNVDNGSHVPFTSRQVEISAGLANGVMSLDEARAQLDLEIVASWGVPPAVLGEHTRKAGDPVPGEQCPQCGARFYGTPDYLRTAFKMHRQLGCRA